MASHVVHQCDESAPSIDVSKFDFLRPFVDLQKNGERCSESGIFIAEGTETIRLLLRSNLVVRAIVCKPCLWTDDPVNLSAEVAERERRLSSLLSSSSAASADDDDDDDDDAAATASKRPRTDPSLPMNVLLASVSQLASVAGFSISRGCLACGEIPSLSYPSLASQLRSQSLSCPSRPLRFLALDKLCDTANLGSLLRISSAFGASAVLLSPDSCDAWYRRSVRVSMGHVFRLAVLRCDKSADLKGGRTGLSAALEQLHEDFGIEAYAACVDEGGRTLILEELAPNAVKGGGWCAVMGNEGDGIRKEVIDACKYKIKIGMEEGVDSLNVAVAAGILMHGLREREDKTALRAKPTNNINK